MQIKNTVRYESAQKMWYNINLFQKNGNRCIDGYMWDEHLVLQAWDRYGRDTVKYGISGAGYPVWEFDFNRKRDDFEEHNR